ncbi:MAG: hypothetical protein OEW21_17600 [Betaproteobacteria bacterium]|nr:hypothetical protein [Betaproteobacteria bacterium]
MMMKRLVIVAACGALLALGSIGAQAKLPAGPAKSDAEKAAEAEKKKTADAKEAALLGKAQDRAVAASKRGPGAKAPKRAKK